ncbi:MAG TPA: flavohemoglobin expression-modulating QEGLA motif protein [Polyangiaceae bacterium]
MTERASVPAPPKEKAPAPPGSTSRLADFDADDEVDEKAAAPAAETTSDGVPSIPPLPAAGPWRSYKEIVCQIALRIVDAQRPIRVLQAIRWDNGIEEEFLKKRGREMPKIDAAYYAGVDLGFDPKAKAEEFEQIARDIDADIGPTDGIGDIMKKTALEYRDVVRMLEARGTREFYAYSRKLYGSPKDKFPDGKMTVRDLGHMLYGILTNVDQNALGPVQERNLTSTECAAELNERFAKYFHDTTVRVQADDTILADAAAGNDYVKVRTGAKFSPRDIDILEAHEGWVHVATSLNGQEQPVARWLAKGPPRTVAVQEGLAALLEMFTFRTYPRRARRLNDRVLAVDKAEDGASFLEVFEWFRTEGYDEEECYFNTRRVFRGGVVEGGAPFTKDACYCKGIVLNYAFVRSAIQHNRADLVPMLFVGKVAHEDVPILARRVNDGVIKLPHYVPPMFRDLNGLAIWMAYSAFFSQLENDTLAAHYGKLFEAQ